MKISIREFENANKITAKEINADISEILILEDLFKKNKEDILIYFGSSHKTGLIKLSLTEFRSIEKLLKGKLHLVKNLRKVKLFH